MIRQYVGARYVPKFANPIAWTSGTSYEAMTIVTYNNSSYTSKVPVPATIGNPADNPDYWALTGNYNAQVEQYRQETVQAVQTAQDAQNNITQEIKNREQAVNSINTMLNTPTILCVGDSYGVGYHDGSEHKNESWPFYLSQYPHCIVENYCVAGATAQPDITASYYGGQIDNAKSSGVNADIIVLSAGTNDYLCTDLTASLTDFISHCHTVYPNAKLYIDWNSVSYKQANGDRKTFSTYIETYDNYYQACANNGVPFSSSCINARFTDNSVADDGIHLNANGYKAIANSLINSIFNGSNIPPRMHIAIGGIYGYNYQFYEVNGIALIRSTWDSPIDVTSFVKDGDVSQTIYDGPIVQTGNFKNLFAGIDEDLSTELYSPVIMFDQPATISIDNNNYLGKVSVWIRNNKIRIAIHAFNNGSTGWVQKTSGQKVTITPYELNYCVPAIYFC